MRILCLTVVGYYFLVLAICISLRYTVIKEVPWPGYLQAVVVAVLFIPLLVMSFPGFLRRFFK